MKLGWRVLSFSTALGALSACSPPPVVADAGADVSADVAPTLCTRDPAMCSDGLFCNGSERCMPGATGADARGCLPPDPNPNAVCLANQTCNEQLDQCSSVCTDADHDGHGTTACTGANNDDCDDADPNRFPGNLEVCTGGGLDTHDEDCNPCTVSNEATRDGDLDRDGFAGARCTNPYTTPTLPACDMTFFRVDPGMRVVLGADCDDAPSTGSNVRPNVPETCNGIDDNCNGVADEGLFARLYYADCDNDSFGAAAMTRSQCGLPAAPPSCAAGLSGVWAMTAGDCDDTNRATYPGAMEVCDGRDNNCNGTGSADTTEDADGDMHAPPSPPNGCTTGFLRDDCNDADPTLHPGQPELCNRRDDDCSSGGGVEANEDLDNDMFSATTAACTGGPLPKTDCDDSQVTAHPGVADLCNGRDEDCDGLTDADASAGAMCRANGFQFCGSGTCRVEQLALGTSHTCLLRKTGSVVCWGANNVGQLGNNSTANSNAPVAVSNLTDAVEIAAGSQHTCARRASGSVVCWGANNVGQLGNNTTTNSRVPVPVSNLTDAVEVTASVYHSCARKISGSVVCWGNNGIGQLGNGNTSNSSVPVTVTNMTNAVEVSAGGAHSCARRSTGIVSCWGANTFGQLGNNGSGFSYVPVNASNLTDAGYGLGTGDACACVRRATGAVACWGAGSFGQIGDGGTSDVPVPTAVSNLTDAVDLDVGYGHACARKSTRTVACWGFNNAGQLGNNSTVQSAAPVAVSGLTDVVEIAVGDNHTCASTSAGVVSCWGQNGAGQLGNGTNTSSAVPVAVMGL